MALKKKAWRRGLAAVSAAVLFASIAACGGDDEGSEGDGGVVAADIPLAIAADFVWGPLNVPDDEAAAQVCVPGSRFPRNSEIVWRARITDPVSGEQLDDTTASMQVKLSDGQTLDMRYGAHPRDNPTDYFWTTSFDIPVDYPTGTLGFEIVATGTDGRVGSYVPFNVASSLLTITDDVLETIEES